MEENDLMEIESEQQDQQQSPNPKQGSSAEMHAGSKTAEQSSSSATGAPGTSINDGERDKPSQSSKPNPEEEPQDSEEESQDSEEEESLNNPKLKKGQANLQLDEGLYDKDDTPEIVSNNNNENNNQQDKSKSKSKNKSGKPPPSGTKPRRRKPPGVKSSKPPQKTRRYTQQEEEEDNGRWRYSLKENGANKDAQDIAQGIWDKWGRLYENCAKVFTWIKAVKSETARKFLLQSSQADDGYYDIDRIEKVVRTRLKINGFEVFFRVRFTNDAQTILWVPMTNLDPDLAHAYLWNLHNSGKTKTNEQCRSLADFCPENFSKKKQLATIPTRVSTRQQKTSANEEKDVVSFVTKNNNYVQVDEILSSSDFMTQKELTEGVEPVNLPEYPDPYYVEKMPPFDLKHLETRLARMQELILTKPFEQLNLMKAIYAALPKNTPSKRCCQCGEHHGLISCSSDNCRVSLCFQCTEREIGNINKNVSDPHAAEEPPPSWIQQFVCSECTDRSSYRKNASPQKLLAVIKFYALSPESFHLAAKEDMQRWTKTNNVYLGYNVVFLPLIMNLEMVHCFNAAGRFLTSLQKIAGFNLANILFLFDVHSNRNSMVNLPKADMHWQFGLKKSVDFFDTCLETLHKLKNITELTAPIAAVFYCCAAVEGSLLPLFLRYRIPFAHSLAVANVSDTKTMTEMLLTFLSAQRGTIGEAFGPDFAKLFGSFLVEQLLQMEWISQDHLQLPMQSVAPYSSPQEQTSSATVALPDAALFENMNFAPSQDAYITPPRSPLFATPPSPSPPVVTPTPPSYSPPHVTPADNSSSETLKRKKTQKNHYLKKEHRNIIEQLIPSRVNSRTADNVAKEIVECLTRDHFNKFELFLQKEDFQSTIRGRVYNSWTKQKFTQPKQQ